MGETRSALGVICPPYDEFFGTGKKIADYMIGHKAEVIDITIGELARASGTSDAAVLRLYRRCGFKGFHSLKLVSAREVLGEEQMGRNVSDDIDHSDLRQSLQNTLASKAAELTETVNMMDPANLEYILDKLKHARMVQLAAMGNTIPVAPNGAFRFNRLGIPVVAGDIWETQAAYTFNLGHKDVVMAVSDSGSSKRLQTLTEGARDNGYTVVLITNNRNPPLIGICDYKIVTATREKLLVEEFWFSRVTATAVMEILYFLLRTDTEDSVERIRRHEKIISPGKKR